jgi:hypothetical protein
MQIQALSLLLLNCLAFETAGIETRLEHFVIDTSRPHLGVCRGWTHSGMYLALRAVVTSKSSADFLELEEDTRKLVRERMPDQFPYSQSDFDEALGALSDAQRLKVELAVLLIDGFSCLTDPWWIKRLDLSDQTVKEMKRLKDDIRAKLSGPLYSSAFVKEETTQDKINLAVISSQVNIKYGLGVLRIMRDEERRRLSEVVLGIDMNNPIFRDAIQSDPFAFRPTTLRPE